MSEDRRNLETRRELIRAYMAALADPAKLLRVCASVSGDADDARAAVAAAFEVSEVAARAILDLQVRRFTPQSIEQARSELTELDRRLRETEGI